MTLCYKNSLWQNCAQCKEKWMLCAFCLAQHPHNKAHPKIWGIVKFEVLVPSCLEAWLGKPPVFKIGQEASSTNDVNWFMTNRTSLSLTSNETSKASLTIAVTQDKHLITLKLLTLEEAVGANWCDCAHGCTIPSRFYWLKRGCTAAKEQKMFRSLWEVGGTAVQFLKKRTTVPKVHGKGG